MASSAEGDDSGQAVREILAAAGDGTLPSLTREELFLLSDDPRLTHRGDHDWWQRLDEAGRELVGQTAQRGLVARNLLTAAPGGQELIVDARVRVILRARREPAWLVVLGEPGDADTQIVASGIDLDEDQTAAVLISARIEGIYLNRLVGPADAVSILADWLLRDPLDPTVPVGRTVELVSPRHSAADEVTSKHAIVLGAGGNAGAWVISDVDGESLLPGDPRPVDGPAMRNWLSVALDCAHRPDRAVHGTSGQAMTLSPDAT